MRSWLRRHPRWRRAYARWRLHRLDWTMLHAPYRPPKEYEYIFEEERIFKPEHRVWELPWDLIKLDPKTRREEMILAARLWAHGWLAFFRRKDPAEYSPLWREVAAQEEQIRLRKAGKLIEQIEEFREISADATRDLEDELLRTTKGMKSVKRSSLQEEAASVLSSRASVLQEATRSFVLGYREGVKLQDERRDQDMEFLFKTQTEFVENAKQAYASFREEATGSTGRQQPGAAFTADEKAAGSPFREVPRWGARNDQAGSVSAPQQSAKVGADHEPDSQQGHNRRPVESVEKAGTILKGLRTRWKQFLADDGDETTTSKQDDKSDGQPAAWFRERRSSGDPHQ
ncbi:hypothetical protein FVE85_6340 [Porphyridium purpureum]|uniref:Uncharacterized protein n=1 Tax=Porphyridium purpureum TaxID=35688 RepID=A0A5J4Z603_PORPP|nr:hypothetical protein FVE85_6340 [Porphyridium purpureum]|eukprot:POR2512..scf295_1